MSTSATLARSWKNIPPYVSNGVRNNDKPVYNASCQCGAVRYRALVDPLDAKLCHCRDCQKLHGAPFEWVCIFRKTSIEFISGLEQLYFWSEGLGRGFGSRERSELEKNAKKNNIFSLPVKVSCSKCRSPIADEGRNMWLAYGTLFNFDGGKIPPSFRHTCHLFYSQRVLDIPDNKPKWMGHRRKSPLWKSSVRGNIVGP